MSLTSTRRHGRPRGRHRAGSDTSLLVCAPMWVEAQALRRSVPSALVERTGYGARSLERAEAIAASPARALAVSGVAGATVDGILPGDVVVATEVVDSRTDGPPMRCPTAPLLAAALRRRGLRVHLGRMSTVSSVADAATMADLARDGTIAVDLESAPLIRAGADRVRAVARVVVDAPGHPMVRPDLPVRGARALAELATVGLALQEWAAALGRHDVLLASPRSFCAGVERAIDIVERALDLHGSPVYVRKQIVHNVHVVEDLRRRGAIFVAELDEVPQGAVVVLSAHGVSPAVRRQAQERGLRVIDATCPLVAKVHAEARRQDRRRETVVLVGHAGHEEAEGTLGELEGRGLLVESVADVESLQVPDPTRVSYLMQTTLAVDESSAVVDALRRRFPSLHGPPSDDICYATSNRQQALVEVAERSDVVLVVGSENSSNSRRLVEVAGRCGTPAYLVEDAGQVEPRWLSGAATVGVSAGASAPAPLVDELVEAVRALGGGRVDEHVTTDEPITFSLPKEVMP